MLEHEKLFDEISGKLQELSHKKVEALDAPLAPKHHDRNTERV